MQKLQTQLRLFTFLSAYTGKCIQCFATTLSLSRLHVCGAAATATTDNSKGSPLAMPLTSTAGALILLSLLM